MGKKLEIKIEQVENGFKLTTGGTFRKKELVAESVDALLRYADSIIKDTITRW